MLQEQEVILVKELVQLFIKYSDMRCKNENINKIDESKTKPLPDCIVKTINVEDSIHIASVCMSFSVLFLKKSTDTQGLSIKFVEL